ncbi:hypothetical protein X975_04309, partial [Stegodyphus mimosarum]
MFYSSDFLLNTQLTIKCQSQQQYIPINFGKIHSYLT